MTNLSETKNRAATKPSKKLGNKRGLGRGLDALFGDEEEDTYPQYEAQQEVVDETPSSQTDHNATQISGRKLIGIEKIVPCPDQPRKYFDEKAIKTLAESIEQYGLIQPILVRPSLTKTGYYEIVAGERRWRASQQARLHEVPVVIRELDETQTFQIALVENLQRKDLTPIEEAYGYKRLAVKYEQSHEEIGEALGRSRSHIANMIRLLDLPDSVQAMVELGDLSAGHARALLKATDPSELALQVIEKNLSVRETEKLVAEDVGRDIQRRDAKTKMGQAGFGTKDANLLALEKDLSDRLGMQIVIDMKQDNQAGKMSISFRDLGQLDDIIKRLENPSLV